MLPLPAREFRLSPVASIIPGESQTEGELESHVFEQHFLSGVSRKAAKTFGTGDQRFPKQCIDLCVELSILEVV